MRGKIKPGNVKPVKPRPKRGATQRRAPLMVRCANCGKPFWPDALVPVKLGSFNDATGRPVEPLRVERAWFCSDECMEEWKGDR